MVFSYSFNVKAAATLLTLSLWERVGVRGTIMAGSYFHHPGRLVAMIVSRALWQ